MNYSFFLFIKLFDVFIGVNYQYERLFEDLQNLYEQFNTSKFNNPERGEYECMVDFFTSNRSSILLDFINH